MSKKELGEKSKNGGVRLNGIDHLLALNATHSKQFQDALLKRRQYRVLHPTEIGVMKCMDGRLHLPVMTETALGIIQPWRNVGGKFDLGWDGYQKSVKEWVDYAISRGRNCLVIVTDHFARGDKSRGCRGFNYDEKAAQTFTRGLREQFDRVFGSDPVYTIQCSIETDNEELIFRGKDGATLETSSLKDLSEDGIKRRLTDVFPDMPAEMVPDVLPLVKGNAIHVDEVRSLHRPITDAEHREWVLAVGRGFDWLHEINTALIIGPFDQNLSDVIATAASLIKGNLDDGRIDKERGVVLMTSAPFREIGYTQRLAEEKAKFLANLALGVIKERVPDLLPYLHRLVTTMNYNDRGLNVLDRS